MKSNSSLLDELAGKIRLHLPSSAEEDGAEGFPGGRSKKYALIILFAYSRGSENFGYSEDAEQWVSLQNHLLKSLGAVRQLSDAGNYLFFNDDNSTGTEVGSELRISFTCPTEPCAAQTYHVMVGGWVGLTFPDNMLTDPSDSSTGPGASDEGLYQLGIAMPTPTPGDFDFYSIVANAGDLLNIEVDTSGFGGVLDPIVAIYDSAGNILAFNDDDTDPQELSFDSRIVLRMPFSDTFYIEVGGFNTAIFPTTVLSFPLDAFDSSSGPGAGSQGDYDIIISRNDVDNDFYSFDLEAGDIVGVNLFGGGAVIGLFAENQDLLVATGFETSGIYPPSSPLPGGGNASAAYLVSEPGTYSVGVIFGSGAYGLELRTFRPPQEATGIRQKLFLDFDGATVDTSKFGAGGTQPSVLSPLSSFLPGWGLSGVDEDAVIDAILATVTQNLETDLRLTGSNPDFDIEILNSRDHADVFGDPDVSRIIVGGTTTESGISTIGIAQSIDIGNYDQAEDSLVLLDLMSAPAGDPNSLNSIPLGTANIIDVIGVGVGNVIAHEAGHFFANFHTDTFNQVSSLQDSGGNMPGLVGVGADGIFGSPDDIDVNFVTDDYAPEESFVGMEDTKNALAFGLTAAPSAFQRMVAVPNVGGSAEVELGIALSGSLNGYVRDSSTDALLGTQVFNANRVPLDVGAVDINGSPAMAILGMAADGRAWVEVRDAVTGVLVKDVWFSSGYTPHAMTVLPDMNGNGTSEIAVLMTKDSDNNRAWVHIKDSQTLAYVNNVWFEAGYTPHDIEYVPNIDANAGPELAVLMTRDADNDRAWVHLKDAMSGAFIKNVWFQAGYTPKDLAIISNLGPNPDATPGIKVAVLMVRDSDSRPWVHIKEAWNGMFVNNVWFNLGYTPSRLEIVPDVDPTTGFPLATLAVLTSRDSDARTWVHLKDGVSGAFVRSVWFQGDFVAKDFAVLPDIDANPGKELAVLGEKTNGQMQVEIKDAKTGTWINVVNFP